MGGFSLGSIGGDGGFSAASPGALAQIFTFYVDSIAGLDTNPGTLALPWLSLTKVNAATLTSGQSVGFKRGSSFAGQLTAAGGVTYGAYGTGANPIINGGGSAACFSATSVNNVTVQNLRLTDGTYCLAANVVTGLTITGLEVDHAVDSGIILGNGTANATISGCNIHDNGTNGTDGNGIGVGGGGAAPHDILIQNNTISNSYNDNVRVSMTSAFNTPFNVTVTRNTVFGSIASGGVAADACSNFVVTYNVIYGNTNTNIGVGVYIVPASLNAGANIENVTATIYNNTIVGNNWGILATTGGGGTFTVTAKNNLLENNGTAGSSAEIGLFTVPVPWTSDYNLVYHAAGGNFMHGTAFQTWAQWLTAMTPQDAHSINANPLINPDYTLQTGSPAIGAGVFIAGVSTSNPPNIGAK